MYGLNDDIKNYIDDKIHKNKTFLQNMNFYTEDYKLVSMFDSDMNANLSPQRYFAEVNNRVNTLFNISKELDLVPAFLTITAPPEYHNKSKYYNGSSPRETALYLSKLWSSFRHLKIFKHIKDSSGHNMIYIRVYEPHKSGVPHLHAMVFVPREFLKSVKKKFFEHFTKYKIKRIALKFIDRFDKHIKYDGVSGAIAYILKYMNKTFRNAKDDLMSNEAYYFAYHGIRRFITSQTLIPLWIYRKIKGNEDTRDLHKLTKQYKQGNIYPTFDKEYIMQRYIKKEKIVYDIDDVELSVTVQEKIIYQKNHFISDQFKTSEVHEEKVPTVWKKKSRPIPTYLNGEIISHYLHGKNIPFIKHIAQMGDYELFQLHQNYDLEQENDMYNIFTKELSYDGTYIKYLAIENIMIDRGMLQKDKYDLESFKINDFLGFEEIYMKSYKWYSAEMIGLVK